MRPSVLRGAMRRAGLVDLSMQRFGFFPPLLANTSWGSSVEAALERQPFLRSVLPFQLVKGTLG
jgi:hypothetical protein